MLNIVKSEIATKSKAMIPRAAGTSMHFAPKGASIFSEQKDGLVLSSNNL